MLQRVAVGKVGSILNFMNNVMGLLAPGSFSGGFILTDVIILLGIFCYLVVLGKVEQIEVNS